MSPSPVPDPPMSVVPDALQVGSRPLPEAFLLALGSSNSVSDRTPHLAESPSSDNTGACVCLFCQEAKGWALHQLPCCSAWVHISCLRTWLTGISRLRDTCIACRAVLCTPHVLDPRQEYEQKMEDELADVRFQDPSIKPREFIWTKMKVYDEMEAIHRHPGNPCYRTLANRIMKGFGGFYDKFGWDTSMCNDHATGGDRWLEGFIAISIGNLLRLKSFVFHEFEDFIHYYLELEEYVGRIHDENSMNETTEGSMANGGLDTLDRASLALSGSPNATPRILPSYYGSSSPDPRIQDLPSVPTSPPGQQPEGGSNNVPTGEPGQSAPSPNNRTSPDPEPATERRGRQSSPARNRNDQSNRDRSRSPSADDGRSYRSRNSVEGRNGMFGAMNFHACTVAINHNYGDVHYDRGHGGFDEQNGDR